MRDTESELKVRAEQSEAGQGEVSEGRGEGAPARITYGSWQCVSQGSRYS